MDAMVLETPEVSLRAGDRERFCVDLFLPANPLIQHDKRGATAVLELTDGFVTFWVGGKNLFELKKRRPKAAHLTSHTSLALSMFLEWIYYDRAYDLNGQERSFADIIAGESAPDVRFRRVGDQVSISFNSQDVQRTGAVYRHLSASGTISIQLYESVLLTIAEDLVAVISQRAQCLGKADAWQEWLRGYQAEREAFLTHAAALRNGEAEKVKIPS